MGDPPTTPTTSNSEAVALLEAVSTERSAICAAGALAQLLARLHGLGQRIAAELADLIADIKRAGR